VSTVQQQPDILIIEDDAVAGETFQLMLAAEGYRARLAADAETGLTAVEHSMPAAIIVDLHLPGMEGLEFLRQLRSLMNCGSIPIAVVTGDYLVDDFVASELQLLGARLFFKPLWHEDLSDIASSLTKPIQRV